MQSIKDDKSRYTVWVFIALAVISLAIATAPIYQYNYTFTRYYSDYWVHNIYAQSIRARDFADIYGNYSAYQIILVYPLYHVSVAALSVFTGSIASASVLFIALCNAAAMYLLRRFTRELAPPQDVASAYLIDVVSALSILIISMSSRWLTDGVVMGLQGSPNFFHNPTYVTMRPFALVVFYCFLRLTARGESAPLGKTRKRLYLVFAAALFLSDLAKPSFALVFLFGAGVYMAVRMLRDFKGEWRNSSLPMLLAVLPTLLLMIGQRLAPMTRAREASEAGLFAFDLAPLSQILTAQNLKYVLALFAIPIVFFLWGGFKELRSNRAYIVASLMAVFGSFFIYCLSVRATDHMWGYAISAYFLIMIAMMTAIKRRRPVPRLIVMLALYGVHLYFGIVYIIYICSNGAFAYTKLM